MHGWRAGSRRNIALEAIERGTARIPLGCHAEINKSALIGQVRDTARYPAGITPSVNGPLATLIQWIAAMFCTQLEKHKLEGSAFSGRQIMSMVMTMMIL